MLETIAEWLIASIGQVLEFIVNVFLGALNFDMAEIGQEFPVFITAYGIFRAMGLAIVVLCACWTIFKFFTGRLSEIHDTPIVALIRIPISIALIYGGGLILMKIINIAKLPYDAMLGTNAIEFGNALSTFNPTTWDISHYASFLAEVVGTLAIGPAGVIITAGAILLLTLIMLIVIAVNVTKLMIECCQRFIMIAILFYSAPLAFSAAASSDLAPILKKWFTMFFSQLLLMTLSVWTLKLVLSGFAVNPEASAGYFLKFFLTLALCKVAQRLDTYLQQLGLNSVTTGGGLLNTALGTVASLGITRSLGGRGGAAQSIMGSNGKSNGDGFAQTIFGHGAVASAVKGGKAAFDEYMSGGSEEDAKAAFKKAYADNHGVENYINNRRKQNAQQASAEKAQAGNAARENRSRRYDPDPKRDFEAKARQTGAAAKEATAQYTNLRRSPSVSNIGYEEGATITPEAREAGLRFADADGSTSDNLRNETTGDPMSEAHIVGNSQADVYDGITSMFNDAASAGPEGDELRTAIGNTINDGSEFGAQNILFNTGDHELEDKDGTLATALMQKAGVVGEGESVQDFTRRQTPDQMENGYEIPGGVVLDWNQKDADGNLTHHQAMTGEAFNQLPKTEQESGAWSQSKVGSETLYSRSEPFQQGAAGDAATGAAAEGRYADEFAGRYDQTGDHAADPFGDQGDPHYAGAAAAYAASEQNVEYEAEPWDDDDIGSPRSVDDRGVASEPMASEYSDNGGYDYDDYYEPADIAAAAPADLGAAPGADYSEQSIEGADLGSAAPIDSASVQNPDFSESVYEASDVAAAAGLGAAAGAGYDDPFAEPEDTVASNDFTETYHNPVDYDIPTPDDFGMPDDYANGETPQEYADMGGAPAAPASYDMRPDSGYGESPYEPADSYEAGPAPAESYVQESSISGGVPSGPEPIDDIGPDERTLSKVEYDPSYYEGEVKDDPSIYTGGFNVEDPDYQDIVSSEHHTGDGVTLTPISHDAPRDRADSYTDSSRSAYEPESAHDPASSGQSHPEQAAPVRSAQTPQTAPEAAPAAPAPQAPAAAPTAPGTQAPQTPTPAQATPAAEPESAYQAERPSARNSTAPRPEPAVRQDESVPVKAEQDTTYQLGHKPSRKERAQELKRQKAINPKVTNKPIDGKRR